ncbi:alkaline phosphatase D family protein [Lignipirellula cremea]|uniref:Alkaline phosphatase D n=1 Tax=Lignipirellula cremea TaxID=2528010 RepID=A0A518E0V5_9BACT|nr:alkaline phosphatase D family protein [Lignipirellula cremea]QDU97722.1 Alkaline phosphatase D precursor [Lignipirellula cremea]
MQVSRRHFKLTALAGLLAGWWQPWFGSSSKALAAALRQAEGAAAGPLVGAVTPDTAAIWMYTPADAKIEVRCAPADDPANSLRAAIEPIPTDDLELPGQAWQAALLGLVPNTVYTYQVILDGQTAPEHAGSFRTAPLQGAPVNFRLGLTSCMKVEKPQDSWPLFLQQEPDLHLTLGDTVYADTTDPRVQWRHHLRYRQSPAFARVIRSVPTFALWDDHDFGPDNSDGTAKGKEHSLSGWKRVWRNPGAGAPDLPGAFYRYAWGDVEFFVVDGRYYRSPGKARDDASKTMLGDAQFAWLVAGLKESQAKFKVVASGSTLHHSMHDGWRVYTRARHQFFDAIKTHRIDGVVYLSGSLHNSLAWEHHESDRVGYPLVEVISSGIANSKRLGFATLDFDTTHSDPAMHVRIVNGSGKLRQEQTWRLSQLSHG